MESQFPIVGVIGPGYLHRHLIGPALSLGVELRLLGSTMEMAHENKVGCDVITAIGRGLAHSSVRTLEREGTILRPSAGTMETLNRDLVTSEQVEVREKVIVVIAARSPHSQACAWTPTEIISRNLKDHLFISPANGLSDSVCAELQRATLDLMQKYDVVGVASFLFHVSGADFIVRGVELGPNLFGNWTIDASITDQYEQHLRAILDLPLGDPKMNADFVVSGNFKGSTGKSLYRPYLHLMARNPELKVHQYRDTDSSFAGHVTISGDNLLELIQTMWHTLDYMDGEIDE